MIDKVATHGLAPYPNSKDSGVHWIGNIPEHWRVQRVRNVGEFHVRNFDKHTKEDKVPVRLCKIMRNERGGHPPVEQAKRR